jgi:hydroxymethylpyrimidine kinase / phosphomethylpyrimidine kinase / thiamine-phosphate diphosphorylase
MKTVLIIAGSDPGAGAGLQQDLKAATLLGTYGLTVATALTVQNSQGVYEVHPVAAGVVAAQLDAVLSDFPVHAVKIGMLATANIVHVVAACLKDFLGGRPGEHSSPAPPPDPPPNPLYGGGGGVLGGGAGVHRPLPPPPNKPPIILDPVLAAGQGTALLEEAGVAALKDELLPLTFMLTPNVPEAERLTGMEIKTPAHLEEAARRLQALGPEWVLAKGGHLPGEPVDVLTDGKNAYHLPNPRLAAPHHHGSGCLLAAALAAHLAHGLAVPEAVNRARNLVQQALRFGLPLGRGVGPVNPYAPFLRELARHEVLQALNAAAERLVEEDLSPLIPEVMSNLGYAVPYPQDPQDVAAFPGRILKTPHGTCIPESPAFGASRHIAAIILTAGEFFPHLRSAMNVRYLAGIEELAPKLHLRVADFDRSQEPPEVKAREEGALAWGVAKVLQALKSWQPPPDLIYDKGDWGKEPMIRILGETPLQVVERALALKNALQVRGL